jgi:endonuclease/exonuclease/phosphatase family metal-dependent hydrolase
VARVTAPPAATAEQAAARSSAPGDPQPLRLMTWNVDGGHSQTGVLDVDRQVALMAGSGAQVIALQGVRISTAVDLSTLYHWKLEAATSRTWNALWIPAMPQLAPADAEGNLLLTTLPIAGSATAAFDGAPMNPTLRDAKKSAGWIAVVVNQITVHIATTQLAVDATLRDTQLTQLDGWIASVPTPRLIGGDFQMLPTDAAYSSMASGFKDAWSSVGQPDAPGFTQTVSPVGRFDYWWSELSDQHAIPTAVSVVETSSSSHHAVVIDVAVQ